MQPLSGYVDLQVNGYAEVDFNADQLVTEDVVAVCHRLRKDGVSGILATIITADIEAMCRRLSNIVRVREADVAIAEMIQGIHIEGPFLNEQTGYIGAHPARFARPADVDMMKRLLDAAAGITRLVTLAPERDEGSRVTKFLAEQKIRVSGGHCNPSIDQLRASIDAGLSLFTHLGNGCPSMLPRHENIIQRVLSCSDHLYIGFIADGIHVPFFALQNFIKCCGTERAYIVTDAICGAGLGPGEYTVGDQRIVIDDNWTTWSEDRSHLVGSAGTMPRSADNLRIAMHMNECAIRRIMIDNPQMLLTAGSE